MSPTDTGERVRVHLLRVPDCPLAAQVRTLLRECLAETGIPAVVEDLEGPFPSPTVLIDGVDVVTGAVPSPATSCRLDLPTRTHIVEALRRSSHEHP